MSYNLDQDTPEYFEFILGGNTYKMVYPTTEEIDLMRKEKDDEKRGEMMFNKIEPVTENAPNINDALKKKNVKVLSAFYKMVKAEMGFEE